MLRALLATGIPDDPKQRAFAESIATHVDAIIADFLTSVLSWDALVADPNAWQTDLLGSLWYGRNSLFARPVGVNVSMWNMILRPGSEESFDVGESLTHAFAVRWQRVLGLDESPMVLKDGYPEDHQADWLLRTHFGSLPATRDAIHPRLRGELDSPEAYLAAERDPASNVNIWRKCTAHLAESTMYELDRVAALVEGDDTGAGHPTTKRIVEAMALAESHLAWLVDDAETWMDPARLPDDELVARLRDQGMLFDGNALLGRHELVDLPTPATVPATMRNLRWDPYPEEIPRPADGTPLTQEDLLWLLSLTFGDHYVRDAVDQVMQDATGVVFARAQLALVARWRERLGIQTTVEWYGSCRDEDYIVDLRKPGLGLLRQLPARVPRDEW